MAREARKISKSGNYYVVLRGSELFVTNADKEHFKTLAEKAFETGKVYGCEVLKTEIRLVVYEGEKSVSLSMKSLATSYARYFNRTNDREGKLFSDRFKSEPLESQEDIDFALKQLKKAIPEKRSVQKPKAQPKPKTEELKKEEVKPEMPKPQKKNLPSWLL